MTRRLTIGLLLALAGAIYVSIVLLYSSAHGRLSMPVTYDDSAYFIDALGRFRVFQDGGLGALLADLFRHPPHSPVSSVLATAGFVLFGLRDIAPYLMNALVLAAYLWGLWHIAADTPLPVRMVPVLLGLAVPMGFMAVHEFRPDFLMAWCSVMGLFQLVYGDASNRRAVLRAGLWFGLALLAKPSASLHTLLVMAASLVASAVIAHGSRKAWIARAWIVPAVAAIVAAPYYVVNAEHVMAYVRTVLVGTQSDVWRLPGGFLFHATYFLNGVGGRMMMGPFVYLLVPLAIAAPLRAWRSGERHESGRLLALLAVGILSYLVVSVNPVKNAFFGLTFQFILLMVASRGLTALLLRTPGWVWGVTVAAVLLVTWFSYPPYPMSTWETHGPNRDERATMTRLVNQVVETIEADTDGRPVHVGLAVTGYINAQALQWEAGKRAVEEVFHEGQMAQDLDELEEAFVGMDYIVAASRRTWGVQPTFPSSAYASEMLQFLREDPRWELVAELPTGRRGAYEVFRAAAPSGPAPPAKFHTL